MYIYDKGTLALEDVKYCLAEWNHRKCGKERIEFLGMFTVAVKTCAHPLDRLCSELKL